MMIANLQRLTWFVSLIFLELNLFKFRGIVFIIFNVFKGDNK